MKIALGCDHRGADAAKALAERLNNAGHETHLEHQNPGGTSDYPLAAFEVATRVAAGDAHRGILLCGTGIGMSIAANKVPGARAAALQDEITAEAARAHNDANICCLSADLLGPRLIEKIVDVFLTTDFQGGRHQRRIERIQRIERGENPADPA
jgi:ribose 5-phosphate isomerase B